jgi:hypothetical protein
MKMKKRILWLLTSSLLFSESFSVYSLEAPKSGSNETANTAEDEKSVQTFLNAETTEARNLLSGFSYEMLENYTNQYMSSEKMQSAQNMKEARKLWLIEEYYKRKADKTAADRLFYVFLAVTLLMLLISVLTFKIYKMQKNLQEQD